MHNRILGQLAIHEAVAASLGTRTAVVRMLRLDELTASKSARYGVIIDLSRPYARDWVDWVYTCALTDRVEWFTGGYRVRYLRLAAFSPNAYSDEAEIRVRVFKGERAPHIRYEASPSHRPGIDCATAQGKSCALCQALAREEERR